MEKYALTEAGQLITADGNGNLPGNLPAVEGFAYTMAPESYDYWYTATAVEVVEAKDPYGREVTWRLVAYTDSARFRSHQSPRYGAGLHPVVLADDDERRDIFGLPTLNDALGR